MSSAIKENYEEIKNFVAVVSPFERKERKKKNFAEKKLLLLLLSFIRFKFCLNFFLCWVNQFFCWSWNLQILFSFPLFILLIRILSQKSHFKCCYCDANQARKTFSCGDSGLEIFPLLFLGSWCLGSILQTTIRLSGRRSCHLTESSGFDSAVANCFIRNHHLKTSVSS